MVNRRCYIRSTAMKQLLVLSGCFLLLNACMPTYVDSTKVTTTSQSVTHAEPVHIKRLFVLAVGNLSSRVIADNIYNTLNTAMQQKNGSADFDFINTYKDSTYQPDVHAFPARAYEGYMLLLPKAVNEIDTHREKFVMLAPAPGGYSSASGYGTAYSGIFQLQLFDANKKLVYSGEIRLHFDPSNNQLYKGVVKKLLKELGRQNILLW